MKPSFPASPHTRLPRQVVEDFLKGAWDMDTHFRDAPFSENIPVQMGLLNVWNATFQDLPALAILPYCQALAKLPAHIQQLSMESNGKAVTIDGKPIDYQTGEIDFGEPGTNGQHSFYQLIHQGRVIPAEFIGIIKSQQSVYLKVCCLHCSMLLLFLLLLCTSIVCFKCHIVHASHSFSPLHLCPGRGGVQPRRAHVQLLCTSRRTCSGQGCH